MVRCISLIGKIKHYGCLVMSSSLIYILPLFEYTLSKILFKGYIHNF